MLLSTLVAAVEDGFTFSPQDSVSTEETLLTTESGSDTLQIGRSDLNEKNKKIFQEGHAQFNEHWVVAPEPGVCGV